MNSIKETLNSKFPDDNKSKWLIIGGIVSFVVLILIIIVAVVPCWAGQDQEVLKNTYRDMLKVNSGLKRDTELEKIAQSICGCVFDHDHHKRQSHKPLRSEFLFNWYYLISTEIENTFK